MSVRESHAVQAARLLEGFCAQELRRGATAKHHVVTRPAVMLDELRFFLDVYDPSWRPKRPLAKPRRRRSS